MHNGVSEVVSGTTSSFKNVGGLGGVNGVEELDVHYIRQKTMHSGTYKQGDEITGEMI